MFHEHISKESIFPFNGGLHVIDPNKCIGCSKCAKNCPVNAISGKIKSPFTIDSSVCIKCNACRENCAFGAVYVEA